jgi:hypothetical protein
MGLYVSLLEFNRNVWFNGSPWTARHLGVQLSSGLARHHRRQI